MNYGYFVKRYHVIFDWNHSCTERYIYAKSFSEVLAFFDNTYGSCDLIHSIVELESERVFYECICSK